MGVLHAGRPDRVALKAKIGIIILDATMRFFLNEQAQSAATNINMCHK
jgi:hypothetical protein